MSSRAGCLGCHTLHCTAIPKEDICVVVDNVKPWFIESRRGVSLSESQTDRVGESLAQWPSGHFNSIGVMRLGVTGCYTVDCLGFQSICIIDSTGRYSLLGTSSGRPY